MLPKAPYPVVFLRSAGAKDTKLSVALKLQAQDLNTTSYLSFGDPAALGIDYWDAFRLEPMSETWLELFSLSPENPKIPLVINNLPLPSGEQGMNISLFVDGQLRGQGLSGSYILSWEIPAAWPPDWELSLHDHSRQLAVSMHEQSSYSFEHRSSVTRALKDSRPLITKPPAITRRPGQPDAQQHRLPHIPYVYPKREKPCIAPQPKLLTNYPNPFTGVSVYVSLPKADKAALRVYNAQGLLVLLAKPNFRRISVEWNAGALPAGLYFIRFSSEGVANE